MHAHVVCGNTPSLYAVPLVVHGAAIARVGRRLQKLMLAGLFGRRVGPESGPCKVRARSKEGFLLYDYLCMLSRLRTQLY